MTPVLARTRLGMHAARKLLGSPIVLVPTMGALHDGHIALLRHAAALAQPNGSVVVSVFVNPLQFGAGEDLDRYPRDLDADLAICGREGAALVFAPGEAQMYPAEQLITVDPGPMGQVLEGASRPGFFTGVPAAAGVAGVPGLTAGVTGVPRRARRAGAARRAGPGCPRRAPGRR